MPCVYRIFERGSRNKMFVALLVAVLAVALVFPAAIADSPSDPKRVAFDAVELR